MIRSVSILALFISTLAGMVRAQQPAPALIGIPGPLEWQNTPLDWKIDGGNRLSITSGKQTDWFIPPTGDAAHNNTPRLLFKPADDFVLSAKLTVGFNAQWDGGVLVIYAGDDVWAKLCFEANVERQPSIVSVVTRTLSDDSTHFAIHGNSVYLKIAKAGPAIFFYASEDGRRWTIVRAFSLGPTSQLRVGFSSQSPVGDRCTTVFEYILYSAKKVNLWTGE